MSQYGSAQRTREQGLVMCPKFTKQPSHMGVGLHLGQPSGEKQKSLSQAWHLARVALLLPGLQLPLGRWGGGDSSGIPLPRCWHVLTCHNCPVCTSAQDAQTIQGTPLCSGFWDYLRRHYLGRAWADGNYQLNTKFGCLQCLFPSVKCWQWGALCFVGFWRESSPTL